MSSCKYIHVKSLKPVSGIFYGKRCDFEKKSLSWIIYMGPILSQGSLYWRGRERHTKKSQRGGEMKEQEDVRVMLPQGKEYRQSQAGKTMNGSSSRASAGNISLSVSSVAQSCLTLCDSMNRRTPGLPVHHTLPEFTQTHVHQVSDAIQPSHPLLSPSPPAPNPSQQQGLFQ